MTLPAGIGPARKKEGFFTGMTDAAPGGLP